LRSTPSALQYVKGGWILTSRACASAGALPALMQPTALENNCRVCAYMRIRVLNSHASLSASYLEVQKVVGAQLEDYLVQGGLVWFQEKEFPPEAFGFLMVLFILQSCQRVGICPEQGSSPHLEQFLVQGNHFLLEDFRASLLGERRGLHALIHSRKGRPRWSQSRRGLAWMEDVFVSFSPSFSIPHVCAGLVSSEFGVQYPPSKDLEPPTPRATDLQLG
jgi:uncharacterized protein (DUF3820 family)